MTFLANVTNALLVEAHVKVENLILSATTTAAIAPCRTQMHLKWNKNTLDKTG